MEIAVNHYLLWCDESIEQIEALTRASLMAVWDK